MLQFVYISLICVLPVLSSQYKVFDKIGEPPVYKPVSSLQDKVIYVSVLFITNIGPILEGT